MKISMFMDDMDNFVVEYRVRHGYYAGEMHRRLFKRFPDAFAFIATYILTPCENTISKV